MMYTKPTERLWYRRAVFSLLLIAIAFSPISAQRAVHASTLPTSDHSDHGEHDDLLHKFDQVIEFTQNQGQFSDGVLYRADFPLGQALATREGMLMKAFDPASVQARHEDGMRIEQEMHDGKPFRPLMWQEKGHAWLLHFNNAQPTMRVESRDAHKGTTNYFVGDRSAVDVRSFQEVWYTDVYKATDVRYYPAADGALEYDIICKPGSDPKEIAIEFKGIDNVRVSDKGELVLSSSLGDMVFPAPVVYQKINGKEKSVKSTYKQLGKNSIGFNVEAYDKTETLVIDPIALRWATWVNTNSTGQNHGHCIWVDPSDGAIYVVARVDGLTDNITVGAFNTSSAGNLEMVVGKYLEPTNVGGSGTRVWQTYLGGNGDDNPYAMEQGPDGNLYITGQTSSTNFPLIGGTAFSGSSLNQQAQSGIDVFVLKINTAGNSIKAAIVGGNGADDNFDVRLATNGDVFVGGSTTSTNLLTLNPGSGASNTNNGGSDVFLFRINQDLSSLVWMRNYGGSSTDRASIMLHDPNTGDLFLGGNTSSTNFPQVSARQTTRGGTTAGFLQRISGAGVTTWSSYFSSASSKDANLLCMAFNNNNTAVYFGGVTSGLNTANISASGVYDNTHNGSNDFYVARMDLDQNFLGGTYVGGTSNETNMMGLNVDQNNDPYVFGYTNSSNFPTSATPNVPLQTSLQGENDKVFFKLESDLSALEFSTYFGGSNDDYDPVGQRGIKFSNCRIYTIVTSESRNIPLTQGALNTTKQSGTSTYEPGLVVWANPPDILDNTITSDEIAICAGATPGNITGSAPTYSLPTIVRNGASSSYPSLGSAATYQWQTSTDSLNWTDIAGATSQNLTGSQLGPVSQDTYVRRIIGGDACILAGAADQVVTVRLMTVTGTVTNVSCNGLSDGTIQANANGLPPFQYAWSNGQTTQTATGLAAGSYSVTVTDASGCTATNSFQVGQPQVLGGQTSFTPATCASANGGASASGTGGTAPYSYLWSNGSTGSSINGVPGGNYTVTIRDAHDCTVEVGVNIPSSGQPTANAGSDATITCLTGPEVTLSGSGSAGVSFSWVASNGGNITSGANSSSPTVNAAGTYTLTVTDTQSGCSATDVAAVNRNTNTPNATATGGGELTCSVLSLDLNGGSTTPGATYSWSSTNGFNSSDEDVTVSAAGTYTLTVTDPANGCTKTASVVVTSNNTVPGATAHGGVLNCNVSSIMLVGTGNGTYAWTGPNNFTSTEQNPNVSAAGTYNLVVTGLNGCTSTASTAVTLDDQTPGATAQGGVLNCNVNSIMLVGTGNGTYAWTGPNNFSSTEQNPNVSAAGTYNLVVTGLNGCTSTASTAVTLDDQTPGATAQGGVLNCNVSSIMLVGTGNGTYAWSGPNNFTSTEQSPMVGAAGTYNLVVTGVNGCTSTASTAVTLDDQTPGATAQGGVLNCNVSSIMIVGTGNGTYAWSGPNNFTSTEQNPTVGAAGTYNLVVTGLNGCTSTASTAVTLDDATPGATAQGGVLNCNVSSIMLVGTGNGTYAWSGPNNFTSTEQNPNVGAAGTYDLVVTGANGCTSTASTAVTLDDQTPGATAQGGVLNCNVSSIMLVGTGNGTYAWSGPNNFSSTEQNPMVDVAGTYNLVVTGLNGCTSTASTAVTLDDQTPGATAQGGVLNCNVSSIMLVGTGNGTYAWSGPNSFTSTEQNPNVGAAGTYNLVVTGLNGCTSSASTEVTQDADVPGATAQGGVLNCNVSSIMLVGTGNGTYAWSGPNNFTSTEQNPNVGAAGTYNLVVTGSNGCTSTASTAVTLDDQTPGATAQGGVLNCNVSSIMLVATGNGTYAWSGPNNFTSTEQNPMVGAAGTYSLVVTGANGCTSRATTEVTLDDQTPGATAQGGVLNCNVSSIMLVGTGNGTFAWSGPNGFSSTVQNPNVGAAGTYNLVVTGANGCTSNASAEVTLDEQTPGATAQGGVLNCNVSSIMLVGTGNGTFAWSGPNGFSSTVQNPNVGAAGTYNLVVTGANGCTSEASAEVTQDAEVPGATAQGGVLNCNVSSIMLVGIGNGTFAWSGPNGFSSTLQNPNVGAAGTYNLVVTGANGCTSEASAEVTQDAEVPGATAQGGVLNCNVSSIMLVGTGNGTFAWSGPNGFSSTLQNPNVGAAGTYNLVVTGANGCTSEASAEVTQDAEVPGATAQGGVLNCNVSSIMLVGTGNGTFAWSGPNGFSSTLQNPNVGAAGTYNLVVTGANGCTSEASAEVTQDAEVPGATAQGGVLNCNLSSIMLVGTGNGTFAWSGPNGFSSTLQNPNVGAAGTYNLVVTGANGCTSEASAEVTQDDQTPGATAQGGVLNCNVSSIMLVATGNGTFAWSGPNGFSSTLQNPNVVAAGTYNLVVTGANGCTSEASAEVTQDAEVPGATAQGGVLNCNISSIMLVGIGNGTYAWSGPNNFSSTEQNPNVGAAGTYNLVVTGSNGCTSNASAEVTLDDQTPSASVQGGTLTCTNTSVTLIGSGNGTYAWSGPNNFTSSMPMPIVTEPGTYTLVVTGSNGCTSTAMTTVQFNGTAPIVFLGVESNLPCEGGSLVINSSSTLAGSYLWTGPNGFNSTEAEPTVTLSGTYTLVVTAANGCTGSASVEVMRDECGGECPPIFTSCPSDITVQCADDFSPYGEGGQPTLRDVVLTGDDKDKDKDKDKECPSIVDYGWYEELIGTCPYVIRRTFYATDADGNTETCVQLITVIDDIAPIFEGTIADITVSCDADLDNVQIPAVWAYDECTKTEMPAYMNVTYVDGKCASEYSIVYSWTSVDYCGNMSETTWTIHVVDNTAPTFVCDMADMTVFCDEVPKAPYCSAMDNCDPNVQVNFSEDKTDENCDKGYMITRTWTAIDACGNVGQAVQNITVVGNKGDGLNGGSDEMNVIVSPNPFRHEAMIAFTPKESGKAMIEVMDMQGRKVAQPFNGTVQKGMPVRVEFKPERNGAGTFFYRIELNGKELRGRMLYQP